MLDALTQAGHAPCPQVSTAALVAARSWLVAAPSCLGPNLDRLFPPLFAKLADPKDGVSRTAAEALDAAGAAYRADALLPGLSRALDAVKVAKARVSALEFAAKFVGERRARRGGDRSCSRFSLLGHCCAEFYTAFGAPARSLHSHMPARWHSHMPAPAVQLHVAVNLRALHAATLMTSSLCPLPQSLQARAPPAASPPCPPT